MCNCSSKAQEEKNIFYLGFARLKRVYTYKKIERRILFYRKISVAVFKMKRKDRKRDKKMLDLKKKRVNFTCVVQNKPFILNLII
jgi:hypothetical protein